MSTLREAAYAALNWFEVNLDTRRCSVDSLRTVNALRAALAQPERRTMTPKELAASIKRGARWKLVEPEPPPEAQTEAEQRAYCFGWWKALESARKPLTEEEIAVAATAVPLFAPDDGFAASGECRRSVVDFARAVERAHGIGGKE